MAAVAFELPSDKGSLAASGEQQTLSLSSEKTLLRKQICAFLPWSL
jgi:hypothetical protein